MKILCCFFSVFFFVSHPAANAQSKPDSVIVLPVKIAAPIGAKKIGAISIGDNAVKTHCDYEELVRAAKQKARAMGGNIVKITALVAPAFISKCYKIKADVYFVNELPAYPTQHISNIVNPGDEKYATLYVYRLPDTLAVINAYKLHMDNDSVLCTIKSRAKEAIKIYKEGTMTLWAETSKRTELKLDVKYGTDYYVRCGLEKGEIRMIPVIELVDKKTGAEQYANLKNKKKNKDADIIYLQQIH